jgi:hypothetical protein
MRCQPFCPTNVAAVLRQAMKWFVFLGLCALTWNASGGSPTAPSVPAADFAAQFDSLWTTFDREYSYFDYKQIEPQGASASPGTFPLAGGWVYTVSR